MVSLSFINPLSEEGQRIVKEKGDLNSIFSINEDLIDIVTHDQRQNIDDDSLIPKSYGYLAIKRIQWFIERKNNKNFINDDYSYLLNDEIAEFDVISFHLISQAIATNFNLNSREVRLFVESQGKLVEERLIKLMPQERKEIVNKILIQLIFEENISWTFLKDLVASKKISLTDLVLSNGKIILNKEDFIDRFGDKFKDRAPDRMYEIIIGDSIKELILTTMIMQNTENYLQKIKDMSSTIEIHPAISELAEEITKTISELSSKYSEFHGPSGQESYMKIGKLIKDAFPPCITNTVEGVSSGGRNDAIVLLLTSFVSYARLYPAIFKNEGVDVKVSDIDPNLNITLNEILPLIYEAANNCSPPLFDDQPQEKINITSKLGFGMHNDPDIENEGETTWYTPMSCEKIKMHLPQLCRPDKTCEKIGNPLSYYSRSKWQMQKEEKTKQAKETK
ncbi:DNA primase large subunit PriL [Candidatus Methanobinarius endosymbioticus]|uniref:DNA primase large subunit PriL n=1 Tax=Candidatus Methanobinarius endosymbioticus TaxID=2006182 RepID=A0A366MDK0_9EURY|nr:DNA primase large subunit PriL [Candidatus Methanobinarius endosymbioticus]